MIPKILIPEKWRHRVYVLRLEPNIFYTSLEWQVIDQFSNVEIALDCYDLFAINLYIPLSAVFYPESFL